MKYDVFNRNLLPVTNGNLKRVEGPFGVDTDSQYAFKPQGGVTTHHPQMTVYGNVVPPAPKIDIYPPIVTVVVPPVGGFIGSGWFVTPWIFFDFSEVVVNSTMIFNWEIFADAHMGTLAIDRIVEIPNPGGGTRVQIFFQGTMNASERPRASP